MRSEASEGKRLENVKILLQGQAATGKYKPHPKAQYRTEAREA